MTTLNLFPARIAFVNPDGTLTAEAYRALTVLFARVGGPLGDNGVDVFGSVFGVANETGSLSTLQTDVVQPQSETRLLADLVQQSANFGTDFYGDVVQSPAVDMSFADVIQPSSKDREAGTFTTIDVSGNAAIGGALKLAAGTVGLPSLYWSTDTTTGFYRIGANNNGYAVGGVKVLDLLSTGLTVTGTLIASGQINYSTGAFVIGAGTSSTAANQIAANGNVVALYGNQYFSAGFKYSSTAAAGYMWFDKTTGNWTAETYASGSVGTAIPAASARWKLTSTGLAVTGLLSSTGALTTPGGATFHTTSTALTNGAGAAAGTITNAPAAGNPTKWIGINDNGTTRYIPAW